jgi:hypothetical protein
MQEQRVLMSKQIQYSDEPLSEIRIVADCLPSPEELALKNEQTKVTISLSAESIAFFKEVARKHHTPRPEDDQVAAR